MARTVLRHSLFWVCTSLFLAGAGQQPAGHWTFETGEELKDRAGNFEELELHGARVENGFLVVDSSTWAMAAGYTGPDLGLNKSLLVWLILDGLESRQGAPICLNATGRQFVDGIFYGEINAREWWPGSDWHFRSHALDHSVSEKLDGEMVQIALVHRGLNQGKVEVSMYRNGALMGRFPAPVRQFYHTASTEVYLGRKPAWTLRGDSWMRCRIAEARVYNRALNGEEVRAMEMVRVETDAPKGGFEWALWAMVALGLMGLALFFLRRNARR